MKFMYFCAFFICVMWTVDARKGGLKRNLAALKDQVDQLRSLHIEDITRLERQIEDLKKRPVTCTDTETHNEKVTLEWAKSSMQEIRVEMRELGKNVNSSHLLRQLNTIRNELQQALSETRDLSHMTLAQEARVDKLTSEIGTLKHDGHQMRSDTALLRSHFGKMFKELKLNKFENMDMTSNNEIQAPKKMGVGEVRMTHRKIRHNKMVHKQISRLARTQNQLDEYQQNLQTQLLDVQRRLDRVEEPNWNLMSTKVNQLEVETKALGDELHNMSQKISDLSKLHASVLELREDIESIENKADVTIPEFRKEISKLDVSFAQLNAQSSYLKEDQENLRQSVKAIAVSVSNTIDRAEMDRVVLKEINDTVAKLEIRSKHHYHRLNDHILKSEAKNSNLVNNTSVQIPLPELMGEVKELQHVEREYEDLVNKLPKDCSEVAEPAGIYLIHPGKSPVETCCNNGTTLVQRRYNGSVEFNRKYIEYVQGFGNATTEFWLGLEAIHELTWDNCSSMRIDMTDIYGSVWYAEYDRFFVGDAHTGYILELSGFSGNASDAFEYQNHMQFSTIDRDRDTSNTHCAGNYEGGWWFSHCQHVNINGKYTLGLTWFDSARNEWIAVASSEMRLRRRPECV